MEGMDAAAAWASTGVHGSAVDHRKQSLALRFLLAQETELALSNTK